MWGCGQTNQQGAVRCTLVSLEEKNFYSNYFSFISPRIFTLFQ